LADLSFLSGSEPPAVFQFLLAGLVERFDPAHGGDDAKEALLVGGGVFYFDIAFSVEFLLVSPSCR